MTSLTIHTLVLMCALAPISTSSAPAQPPTIVTPRHRIAITFPAESLETPVSGRLLLWFIRGDASDLAQDDPADGPFIDNPQPMLGVTLERLAPGSTTRIPGPDAPVIDVFGKLGPGSYRMQATFDWQRLAGDWRNEPGNLYSDVIDLTIAEGDNAPFDLTITLDRAVPPLERPETPGVEWFSVRSQLLSDFRLRDVELRAGVIPPRRLEEGSLYPAVYFVPGFGGDDRMASFLVRLMSADAGSALSNLHDEAFVIVLDPDSANGHTLFADSGVNGPCGGALVEELIPALEATYPLIADPQARIVRGHSSGGWSTVWLCLMYPEVFGHGFASSPDPIDFRAFQESSIHGANFYVDTEGAFFGNNIHDGRATLSIAQENLIEEVIGPLNTSGQQWDSWLAVFGPRTARGLPADLFDPFTGQVDPRVARHFEAYDIGVQLRADPDRFGPIFRDRLRIVVGDEDEWSLHKGVRLVEQDLQGMGYDTDEGAPHDESIVIAPGYDHGSIHGSPAMEALSEAMLEQVKATAALGGDP